MEHTIDSIRAEIRAPSLHSCRMYVRSRGSVVHWRLTRICRGLRLAGAAVVAICVLGSGANAQGKVDARFVVTLAGVPIGKGAWVIDIGDDQFTAAASGMTTGLLRVFATGQGNAASRGAVRNDILVPTIFVSTINNDKRIEELRIVLSAGTVKELAVDPPTTPNPERIALTDAHRRGVIDPMSAALMRVSGSSDPISPEACRRTVPVFDGRMRFDLQLSFKRIEKVQAQKGYQGPVVVCAVQFVPLAWYVPERAAIKYLMAQQAMEIWLPATPATPVAGPIARGLQPPVGRGVIPGTQFLAATNPRSTPAPPAPP